jgi:hypothetical protein
MVFYLVNSIRRGVANDHLRLLRDRRRPNHLSLTPHANQCYKSQAAADLAEGRTVAAEAINISNFLPIINSIYHEPHLALKAGDGLVGRFGVRIVSVSPHFE